MDSDGKWIGSFHFRLPFPPFADFFAFQQRDVGENSRWWVHTAVRVKTSEIFFFYLIELIKFCGSFWRSAWRRELKPRLTIDELMQILLHSRHAIVL